MLKKIGFAVSFFILMPLFCWSNLPDSRVTDLLDRTDSIVSDRHTVQDSVLHADSSSSIDRSTILKKYPVSDQDTSVFKKIDSDAIFIQGTAKDLQRLPKGSQVAVPKSADSVSRALKGLLTKGKAGGARILTEQPEINKQDSSIRDEIDMDDVVISMTRTPKALKNIPIITNVVGRKELERVQPRSAVEMLEMSLPGMESSRHGGQTRLKIQGLDAQYTLFLLDGERISGEGGGTVDLSAINPNNIQKVEIMRGAASALYGSNAIGCVINFITRKPIHAVESSVSAMYDSKRLQDYSAFVGVNYKYIRSSLSAGFNWQQPFTIVTRDQQKDIVPEQKVISTSLTNTIKLLDSKLRLTLGGNFSRRLQDDARNEQQRFRYDVARASLRAQWTATDYLSFDFSHVFDYYNRDNIFLVSGRASHVFNGMNYSGRLQGNYLPSNRWIPSLSVGVQGYLETMESLRVRNQTWRYWVMNTTGYVQADWSPFWFMSTTAGLRVDYHSRFGVHVTPRMAVMFRYKKFSVRLSYSEGFKAPELKEMYFFFDHFGMFFIYGNPDLKPESSRMYSIAPEFQWKGLNLSLMAYYNEIQDRIINQFVTKTRIEYFNAKGMSRLFGLQPMIRWNLPYGFNLTANYAFLYEPLTAEDKEDLGGREDVSISGTRPHSGTLTLSYSYGKLPLKQKIGVDLAIKMFAPVTAAFFQQQLDGGVTTTIETFEGYTMMRLTASYSFDRYLTLAATIDNLLNYRPNQIAAINPLTPGRTYSIKLTLRY